MVNLRIHGESGRVKVNSRLMAAVNMAEMALRCRYQKDIIEQAARMIDAVKETTRDEFILDHMQLIQWSLNRLPQVEPSLLEASLRYISLLAIYLEGNTEGFHE